MLISFLIIGWLQRVFEKLECIREIWACKGNTECFIFSAFDVRGCFVREVFEAGGVEGTFLHLYKYVCHSVHYTVKFLHSRIVHVKAICLSQCLFCILICFQTDALNVKLLEREIQTYLDGCGHKRLVDVHMYSFSRLTSISGVCSYEILLIILAESLSSQAVFLGIVFWNLEQFATLKHSLSHPPIFLLVIQSWMLMVAWNE